MGVPSPEASPARVLSSVGALSAIDPQPRLRERRDFSQRLNSGLERVLLGSQMAELAGN